MLANIIVIAILAVCVGFAVRKIVIDKKNGVGSCGCGCASCPSHGSCHSNSSK